MITESKFIEAINFIKKQVSMKENNSSLIKVLIRKLQLHFPRDKDGFCAIEHYCFFTNFGKESSDSEYVSPKELYQSLTK